MAIERALAARQGHQEGRELRFLCPAHEDCHPSARWNKEKQTWYCEACKVGGGWRDLAELLGLDLQRAENPLAEIEAVYDYRAADGELRFQVLRKRGKTFACRRPLPGGGWAWNLTGVERLLYRLPETLAAARAGGVVYVVEGEKDADRLAGLGLAATTNPGGAGKWLPWYSATLQSAHVVLLPDCDATPRASAQRWPGSQATSGSWSCQDCPRRATCRIGSRPENARDRRRFRRDPAVAAVGRLEQTAVRGHRKQRPRLLRVRRQAGDDPGVRSDGSPRSSSGSGRQRHEQHHRNDPGGAQRPPTAARHTAAPARSESWHGNLLRTAAPSRGASLPLPDSTQGARRTSRPSQPEQAAAWQG